MGALLGALADGGRRSCTLLTFGGLLLAPLGAIIAFCTLCTGLALSGCFGRRRSCRRYLRGRLLSSFAIALGTLGALTAVVAVVIASIAVIVTATITIVVTAVVAIATTFASRTLGLVVVTLLAILLTAFAALLAIITFLTLLTAVIAFVALATLLTGLTTTTLLTLVGLLLLRLSRSCGLGRSFLALLIVAVLLALAARLLTLEGLIIGALTK